MAGGQKAASRQGSSDSIGSTASSGAALPDDDLKDVAGWNEEPRRSTSSSAIAECFRVHSPLIVQDQRLLKVKSLKQKTASWKELPNKGQLALLTVSRLAEPLTQTSLQSYMFYQLKSFDQLQPDSAISSQAGLLAAAFTAAQFVTAIPWGRAADSELFGRKWVLLLGLLGTMISALGFGFSRSFWSAVCFRTLGGAFNGNVGVMRTVSHTSCSTETLLTPSTDDFRNNQGKTISNSSFHAAANDIQYRSYYWSNSR